MGRWPDLSSPYMGRWPEGPEGPNSSPPAGEVAPKAPEGAIPWLTRRPSNHELSTHCEVHRPRSQLLDLHRVGAEPDLTPKLVLHPARAHRPELKSVRLALDAGIVHGVAELKEIRVRVRDVEPQLEPIPSLDMTQRQLEVEYPRLHRRQGHGLAEDGRARRWAW